MNDEENYPSKENEKLVPTAGVVAVKENSILLVSHDPGGSHITGTYGLPSGRVNENETERQAAAREFEEETGIAIVETDLKEFENNYVEADVPRKNGTSVRMSWRIFKVENFSGDLKSNPETTPVWLSLRQVEKLDTQNKLAPNVLRVVNAALK